MISIHSALRRSAPLSAKTFLASPSGGIQRILSSSSSSRCVPSLTSSTAISSHHHHGGISSSSSSIRQSPLSSSFRLRCQQGGSSSTSFSTQQQQQRTFSNTSAPIVKSRDETVDLSHIDFLSTTTASTTTTSTTTTTSDTAEATATLLLDAQCELGECILWDDATQSLLWTDILQQRFHVLDLNDSSARHVAYDLPKKLGAFGLLAADDKTVSNNNDSRPLLCAWEDGFQLYDIPQDQALSDYSEGPDVNPAKGVTRLNDGRTDQAGQRFIGGGCNGGDASQTLSVFAVEQTESSLRHQEIVAGMRVTNSICFSPKGDEMYLADSPTRQIWSFDYNNNNSDNDILSNKTVLHNKADWLEHGVADGSVTDAEGYLWNAVWSPHFDHNGVVQRIHPTTGQVVFTVHVPDRVSQVSCCCFGGPNLDVLFMTTAAEELDRAALGQPRAGALYAVQLPFRGVPESRLKFQF